MRRSRKTQFNKKSQQKRRKNQRKPRESIPNNRNTDADISGLLQTFKIATEQLNNTVKEVRKMKENKLFETPVQAPLLRDQRRARCQRAPKRIGTARNSRLSSKPLALLKWRRSLLLRDIDGAKLSSESVEPDNATPSTESINGAPASVSSLPLTTGKESSTADGSTADLPIWSTECVVIATNASNSSMPDQVETVCYEAWMPDESQPAIPVQQYSSAFVNALKAFYSMFQRNDENSSYSALDKGEKNTDGDTSE